MPRRSGENSLARLFDKSAEARTWRRIGRWLVYDTKGVDIHTWLPKEDAVRRVTQHLTDVTFAIDHPSEGRQVNRFVCQCCMPVTTGGERRLCEGFKSLPYEDVSVMPTLSAQKSVHDVEQLGCSACIARADGKMREEDMEIMGALPPAAHEKSDDDLSHLWTNSRARETPARLYLPDWVYTSADVRAFRKPKRLAKRRERRTAST